MCTCSICVDRSSLENTSFGQDRIDSGQQPVLGFAEGPPKSEAVIESCRPRGILIFDIYGAEWKTLNHRRMGFSIYLTTKHRIFLYFLKIMGDPNITISDLGRRNVSHPQCCQGPEVADSHRKVSSMEDKGH